MSHTTVTLADATDTMSYLTALIIDSSKHGKSVRSAWLQAGKMLQEDCMASDVIGQVVSESLRGASKIGQMDVGELSNEAFQPLLDHLVDVIIPRTLQAHVKLYEGCACDRAHIAELMLLMATFIIAPPYELMTVRARVRDGGRVQEDEGRQKQFMVDFLKDLFWYVGASKKTGKFQTTKEKWDTQLEAFRMYCAENVSTPKDESVLSADTASAAAGSSSAQSLPIGGTSAGSRFSELGPGTSLIPTSQSQYRPLAPATPLSTQDLSMVFRDSLWYPGPEQ